jgi:hypothetical protein
MPKKGAEDEVNWQLDKLVDWHMIEFVDRPGVYKLTPKGKAVLEVLTRTLHGWDWRAIDPARCGQYVVGYRYPKGPFVVVKCHNKMPNAKTTYKRVQSLMHRSFKKGSPPYIPRTRVQIRDKKTGQIRHEITLTKPGS